MTIKTKILKILLLVVIAIVYFKVTTFVVKSFAYPNNYKEGKVTQIIPSNQIAKH